MTGKVRATKVIFASDKTYIHVYIQTLDPEGGRLDSSKPSMAPPLCEVAALHERGVVGLALAVADFRVIDLERGCRTVQ